MLRGAANGLSDGSPFFFGESWFGAASLPNIRGWLSLRFRGVSRLSLGDCSGWITNSRLNGDGMRAVIALILTSLAATTVAAQSKSDVICSYAPSQSTAVAAVSGAAGGASATASAVATATGLTAVAHSSGALILTGSSGYIAGTLGATAATVAVAPIVITVGLVVGGSAVTLELVCAQKNHPELVAKIDAAAVEFSKRFELTMQKTKVSVGEMKKAIAPMAGNAAVRVKTISADIWEYVYRKGSELSGSAGKK